MRSIRSAGITAATAAIALSLGAIPIAVVTPTLLGGGDATTSLTPASVSLGPLVLSTTSTEGRVSWNGTTQVFTGGQQCAITAPADSLHLLDIRGSVGGDQDATAGFRDGDIGVFEATATGSDPNNASQCFRVDSGSFTDKEILTLTLGDYSGLSDMFGRFSAESATVDIYAKTQTGSVRVETQDVEGNWTGTTYTWPKTKLGNKITVVPALNPGTPFYGVRLTAGDPAVTATPGGSFSLRGATFNLVSRADAVLDCTNPSITEGTTTATFVGNAGPTGCTGGGFGVVLTTGTNTLELVKPPNIGPEAQFVIDYEWEGDANTGPTGDLVPRTKADFDGAGSADDETVLAWCPELVPHGAFLVVRDVKNNAKAPDLAPNYVVGGNAKQFACIISQEPTLVPPASGMGESRLKVKESVYVYGDIKLLR